MTSLSRNMRVIALAIAIALCAGTIAVASTGVVPKIILPRPKTVVSFGQASPFKVEAWSDGAKSSFDGTVTVWASTESSVTGFSKLIASKPTTARVVNVNAKKLMQDTWFLASYESSAGAVTTSTAMIGVKARLGSVQVKQPKKAGGNIAVAGSVEITPAVAGSLKVELRKQKVTTTTKGKGKSKVKKTVVSWETVAEQTPTLTKKKGAKYWYTFKSTFATTAADKGSTFRVHVTHDDATHSRATRASRMIMLRK